MKLFGTEKLRNVGLFGHQGSGKTTLAEAISYLGRATTRLCRVADENSNYDFDVEEIRRKSSMLTAVGYGEWKGHLVNVVDTPGDSNYLAEPAYACYAVDLGVIVVSAVDGVQIGTERAFELLRDAGLPQVIFVNKIDKERANLDRTLAQLQEAFGGSVVPLFYPNGVERSFTGVVDLHDLRFLSFDEDGKVSSSQCPESLKETVGSWREKLVEKLAEQDDELIEKYFADGDLDPKDLEAALAKGLREGGVVPAIVGDALTLRGVTMLLDTIVKYGPCPLDRAAYPATRGGEEVRLEVQKEGGFLGFVFKTIVDPHAGRTSLVRVIQGEAPPDGTFKNVRTGSQERYGQLYKLLGKKQEAAPVGVAGDIVAMQKLKDTRTGDTIAADRDAPQVVAPDLPQRPAVVAVKPKTQGDEDKVSAALQKLIDEDVGLQVTRDEEANDMLLSGMGQVHIDTALERLRKKFGVEVVQKQRRVPYRETIRGSARRVEGKHKKQTGGHGQYGICYIDLEPLPRGEGFQFVDAIFGGAIPKQYIPSVEKGIKEAMAKGVVAGYPVVDVKVTLVDGKYHEVDSDNRSFELAGSRAFKAAFKQSQPIILEPIMNLTIVVPEECLGDVMGDISARRGRVLGMESAGKKMQVVRAAVPMAEVLTYASDLRSMTSDRGSFTVEFSHYEELPSHLAEKLVQEARIEEEEE